MQKTLFLLLLSLNVFGQNVLKGKVFDASNKEPLPFANVFFNNTSIGTQTDFEGKFQLTNPNIEKAILVVNYVGFESYMADIKSFKLNDSIFVALKPIAQNLKEVQISGKKDKTWQSNFALFSKAFLGKKQSAATCEIINKFDLDFEKIGLKLIAKANQPLEIENRFLGYRQFIYLKKFELLPESNLILFQSRYELLKPKHEEENQLWQTNRQEAFLGSLDHFIQSLINKNTDSQGFRIYTENPEFVNKVRSDRFNYELNAKKSIRRIAADSLIKIKKEGVFLNFPATLEVHYLNEKANRPLYADLLHQVSWLESTTKELKIDTISKSIDFSKITRSGAMNEHKMAELLPLDFQSLASSKNTKTLQEQVFLQTNKPFYYPKETIWLKAGLYSPNLTPFDSLSQILYVDLILGQKLIQHHAFQLQNGIAIGQISLADSIKKGQYFLRAYTRWSAENDYIFHREIPVLNTSETLAIQEVNPISNADLITIIPEKIQPKDSVEISFKAKPNTSYAVRIVSESFQSTDLIENLNAFKDSVKHQNFEQGFLIKGSLKHKSKSPVQVSILNRSSNQFELKELDSKGNFEVENQRTDDSLNILVSAKNKKKEVFKNIELNTQFIPKIEPIESSKLATIALNKVIEKDYFNLIANANNLEEVEVKAKKRIIEIDERITKIYGKADYVVKIEEDGKSTVQDNVITYLQGRVPGLNIVEALETKGFSNDRLYYVRLRGTGGFNSKKIAGDNTSRTYEPLFLVDGMPIENVNSLSFLNVQSIDRVEVISQANALFGSRGANGVIAIYTHNAGRNKAPLANIPPDFMAFNLAGFTKSMAFSRSEGNAATLFWQADCRTNQDGIGQLKCHVGNQKGRFIIEIEGIENQKIKRIWRAVVVE
jgi:CarboxypepD_reg-like domain/TonB-dependent Receptor Plug Domain